MTTPTFTPPHANADVIPVRMCNELVYCERLFYIEHVQGVFVDSADTVAGRDEHERAARRGRRRRKTAVDDEPPPWPEVPRSLDIVSPSWGVRGKIDFLEMDDDEVVVVEAKHGRAPRPQAFRWRGHELPECAWPADVAQLGLYMAILREFGLEANEGRIFYRKSRTTVGIQWSDGLEAFLHDVVRRARVVGKQDTPPPPLRDSPKCPGCSLHEVCLPDEYYALREHHPVSRRLPIARDERQVVYITTAGSTLRKDGDALNIVDREGNATRVLSKDIGHIAVFGPSQVTSQALGGLLRQGVDFSHHTTTGTLLGITHALATRNVVLRRAQYRVADDPDACLTIARSLVVAKIRNQRTLLRRQLRQPQAEDERRPTIQAQLDRIRAAMRWAERAANLDILRGYEGEAAHQYFEALGRLLPLDWRSELRGRSRRPPRDRGNAILSFSYTLLTREAIAAIARVGLDPMLGFFHSLIPGRPALALDLIEPFRPAWTDTATMRLLATNGISREEFEATSAGTFLSASGRRKVIAAHERRAREETSHPRFGYRMSYRRILELEIRLLGKYLLGELDDYVPLWTR